MALAYQQRCSVTSRGMAVLDQNGDLVRLAPLRAAASLIEEFVEVKPVLQIDSAAFLEFAGDELRGCIESIQSHWLAMAQAGFGDSLEELCDAFARPWDGDFTSVLCAYEIRKGQGCFAGLDRMRFRLAQSDDSSKIKGFVYVDGEPHPFAFVADRGKPFYRDLLRSCVPSADGDRVLELLMKTQ